MKIGTVKNLQFECHLNVFTTFKQDTNTNSCASITHMYTRVSYTVHAPTGSACRNQSMTMTFRGSCLILGSSTMSIVSATVTPAGSSLAVGGCGRAVARGSTDWRLALCPDSSCSWIHGPTWPIFHQESNRRPSCVGFHCGCCCFCCGCCCCYCWILRVHGKKKKKVHPSLRSEPADSGSARS
jgi:hypothetical protein